MEKYVLAGEIDKSIELLSSIQLTCNESDFLNSVGDIYYSLNDLENAYIFYFKNYNIHGLVNTNKMSVINFLISSYKRGYYLAFNDVISDPNFNASNYMQINDLISQNNFALESNRKDLDIKTHSLEINSFADEYFPSMPINSEILIYTYRNSNKEFVKFLSIAQGSSYELATQLYLATDLGYFKMSSLEELFSDLDEIQKINRTLQNKFQTL